MDSQPPETKAMEEAGRGEPGHEVTQRDEQPAPALSAA